MRSVGTNEAFLITKPTELSRLAKLLVNEQVVAVDTESNSLYAYRERVCLIQFSTISVDYLVDPLALKDLSPLAELFTSPNTEKIFHAAEYDLICLRRDFGFTFTNLFDTMVAARILGRTGVGLGAILEEEFDVKLDKHYQRANWGQRPLTRALLSYARLDTHYLIPLRDRLQLALEENQRWELACEDFRRLCHINGRALEDEEETTFRVSHANELNPQQAAVLRELSDYREQMAQLMDRPRFKVIGDKTLVAIAKEAPASETQLAHIQGMTAGQIERHGKKLLEAVQRGLKADPVYPIRSPRPNEQYLNRLDALRQWRKKAAQDMQVESDVILPRDLLTMLADRGPRNEAELQKVFEETPWRLRRFGGEILQVLNHKNKGEGE